MDFDIFVIMFWKYIIGIAIGYCVTLLFKPRSVKDIRTAILVVFLAGLGISIFFHIPVKYTIIMTLGFACVINLQWTMKEKRKAPEDRDKQKN